MLFKIFNTNYQQHFIKFVIALFSLPAC